VEVAHNFFWVLCSLGRQSAEVRYKLMIIAFLAVKANRDRPLIGWIMNRTIRPVGYVGG